MSNSIQTIPVFNLALMAIPVVVVTFIYYFWMMRYRAILYAFLRMTVQLILIGYVLNYLFALENMATVMLVLAVMLLISGWIALQPLKHKSGVIYMRMLVSITIGGLTTLLFTTQAVLELTPWFAVKYMVPLAGIVFSNAMNTVCLAAERFESETEKGGDYTEIRNIAMQAAMIPTVNMLLAVGLVALPGVMTGQILSGVPPLVAVRYQMMIMCLVLGAAGVSTACYLFLMRPEQKEVLDS